MKKGVVLGAATVFAAATLSAWAFAAGSPVKVLVNGEEIQSDVPAQIVEGRTLLPVRAVAEALGAEVAWDGETKTVSVTLSPAADEPQDPESPDTDAEEVGLLEAQVRLLEEALAPQSAEEAAQRYAEGVKTRNGALQFAVLDPDTRESQRAAYQEGGWVTGTSSPWVKEYTVGEGQALPGGAQSFLVEYTYTDSTGAEISVTQVITAAQHDNGNWYVVSVEEGEEKTE